MSKQRIVVVGNGMVGHHFIDQLTNNHSDQFQVVTFAEEKQLAYDRVMLTSYFSGNDLSLTTPEAYDEKGVEYHINEKVTGINRQEKTIVTESGKEVAYDKLVLSTGSIPFVPPVPGKEQEDIHVYRTIDDLDDIAFSAKSSKVGVVIGGGLLGLEAANAIKQLGLETHVVEFAPRLMAVQLDQEGGDLLRNKISELGVTVHTEKNTQEIVQGENCRYRMNFADGTFLETDVIVFSAGIRPQDHLARVSDLSLGERGGIAIDDHCVTSDPDIYAIGECALWDNKIFGLIAPGYAMAKVAVSHLTSQEKSEAKTFKGADMSTKLKLLGVDVASIGDAHAQTPDAQCFSFVDSAAGIYKKVVVSSDGKKLLGAVLVGETSDYGQWLQLVVNDMALTRPAEYLLLPELDDEGASESGVDALPCSAQICSCYDVTKETISKAVADGAHDIAALKSCTQAGTGCGGCVPLLTQIQNSELAKLGVSIDDSLCRHFAYSRSELFDIIRVKNIRTFDALIAECGSGDGCEVCKPAAASMFASLWNEHVLDEELVSLQDTNDNFLANMQKDGTYSIVPRVPGGEITPEQLIAIGEIAKEYKLYTKITGGQRIDLFGAQLAQLPVIWKKMVDVGLETGHAYGKSLRTVKSCVGSTWCRYGVQDSAAMAILVEQRYRGVRSPHKVKMAVSGCARECAEAQSKDFGVIATDKGWNLYVGGNGGMRPRHADLFASDLDDATLIRYIDIIFMFYVRTAQRLQRTSVWLENLEGGLAYLQDVVINDKLSINDELLLQMEHLVDTYQCEWKATLDDPQKLKRFNHFINSDKLDDNVIFTTVRDQIQPASKAEEAELV
ncbi:nitrite reductase large subunit NirB [Litorilituus lipolyticus]|uniref:Nitrite reductase large subunit n=1 Tax=Litorilituus lipolyticus TaxID=2491017 RepID=A0A502L499_9GAMM|nr:nitrite reductase large subunit NirB [Litorilituus lipolyticus]TPH18024.1 nitrite reductase large subunit [Litorilituus lipolyticus]